jgi:hypothetical protein
MGWIATRIATGLSSMGGYERGCAADAPIKNANEIGLNGTSGDVSGWPKQNYKTAALPLS